MITAISSKYEYYITLGIKKMLINRIMCVALAVKKVLATNMSLIDSIN